MDVTLTEPNVTVGLKSIKTFRRYEMGDKITITIEGMKEEPVVVQVDGFALVTFAEEEVKQCTYGLRTSELATASNVLQAVCIRDLLTQQESK